MSSIRNTANITSQVTARSPSTIPPSNRTTGPSSSHHISFITSGQPPNGSPSTSANGLNTATSPTTSYSTNSIDQEDYFALSEPKPNSTIYQYLPDNPNPPTFADKDTKMVKEALDKHKSDGVRGKSRPSVLEECQERSFLQPIHQAGPQFKKTDG